MSRAPITTGQTLIFDADDTLWENNQLFERVIEDFFDWVAHPTLERTALRFLLDEIESANTVAHGYGSRVFLGTLADCFARLRERPANRDEQQQITTLAVALIEHRVELLPGVTETLSQLGERHELRLLTKGDHDEQQAKLDASGLAHHFASIHIVPEKDDATYATLVAQLELDVGRSWMIGNSPKSDILPARHAGLRAVFIPNENPWFLEHAELDLADPGVLRLPTVRDLTRHF
ncbi:MAG: HAD family hydrolase [Propionibacteriaceae bacterium]